MGVRVEGDLGFQRWYYDKYEDVAPIVSHEVYSEYLDYKEQKHINSANFCFIFCFIILVVLIIIFDIIFFMRFLI